VPWTNLATYYPGTHSIAAATRIAVEAGQEIVGIDFDTRNSPTFRISGTVRNIPVAAAANGLANPALGTSPVLGMTFVSADPRSADPTSSPLLTTRSSGANGEFEISLPAGEWDIFPVIPLRASSPAAAASMPAYATGRARVRLTDRNVESVVIDVSSVEVRGHILFPESWPMKESALAAMRVFMIPRDNYPSPLVMHLRTPQQVEPSGEFKFPAVPPGRFALQIATPSGLYLADLRIGTKSIYNDGVITVGTEPLDPVSLELKPGGGTVRVTIGNRDAAPAGGPLKRMVMVPSARRDNALLYKVILVDDRGLATVENVAPGDYKVFAFQELPPGGAEQNRDFMAKYEGFGVTIDVAAGQTVDVQVPWIPSGK
jgi:hypothetical protein